MTSRDIEGESAVDGIPYKTLEAVLAGHFQIHPDRLGTFRSRIKQLQRLGFPGGINIGRGVKMAYTLEHLFKLVTAFELIGMGMPAERATTIVTSNWERFALGYALAWWSRWAGLKDTETYFARLIVRSFGDIQMDEFEELTEQHAAKVVIEDRFHHFNMFRPMVSRRVFCYPVLCLSDIMTEIYIQLACQKVAPGVFEQFAEWPSPEVAGSDDWFMILSAADRLRIMDEERQYLADIGNDPWEHAMGKLLPHYSKARALEPVFFGPARSLMIQWADSDFRCDVEADMAAAWADDDHGEGAIEQMKRDGVLERRKNGELKLTNFGRYLADLIARRDKDSE